MAKINSGTITANGSGAWTSEAITMTSGAKRVYLRVGGNEILYRDFTVADAAIAFSHLGQNIASGLATGEGFPDGGTTLVLSTVPANTLVYVVVDMWCSVTTASPAITSVTVGGNAMTLCGTARTWGNNAGLLGLYRYYSSAGMTTPSVATVGTVTTGNFSHGCRAWGVSNAASDQGGAGYNSAAGTTANPTTSVTTTANSSVIFGVGALYTTNSAGTNTEAVGTEYSAGPALIQSYKNTQTTTGGNAYAVNITQAAGDFWGLVAVEVKRS